MKSHHHVALVGAGAWGKNLMRNLHELGALHSIVDRNPELQETAAELSVRYYPEISDVLVDDAVEAVVIASPAEVHCEMAVSALDSGRHVFVEKPIALTEADANRMAGAAAKNNRILMVGHLLQYHPAYRRLKELVQDGAVGKLQHIVSSRMNFGRIRSYEDVIWSFSPHDISMVLGLIQSPVSDVSSRGVSLAQNGIADIGTLDLRFSNGVTAEIRASWLHPCKEQKLVVIGSSGMIVFDDRVPDERKLVLHRHTVVSHDGERRAVHGNCEPITFASGEPLRLEMEEFLRCVATGATPRTDANEALAVLKVLLQFEGANDA